MYCRVQQWSGVGLQFRLWLQPSLGHLQTQHWREDTSREDRSREDSLEEDTSREQTLGQSQGAQSQLEGAQSLLEGVQLSLETETPGLSSLVPVLPSLNSLSSLPQPEVCRSTPAPVCRVKSRLEPYRGLSPCLMTCARQ